MNAMFLRPATFSQGLAPQISKMFDMLRAPGKLPLRPSVKPPLALDEFLAQPPVLASPEQLRRKSGSMGGMLEDSFGDFGDDNGFDEDLTVAMALG